MNDNVKALECLYLDSDTLVLALNEAGEVLFENSIAKKVAPLKCETFQNLLKRYADQPSFYDTFYVELEDHVYHYQVFKESLSDSTFLYKGYDLNKVTPEAEQNDAKRCRALHRHKISVLHQIGAGLAHEVNNPLGIISLSISIIEDQVDGFQEQMGKNYEKVANYIENIDTAIERTKSILTKLTSFATPRDQELESEQNLNEFIRNTLVFCKDQLKSKGIRLEESFDPDFTFRAPMSSLMQSYLYLLANAVEAIEVEQEEKVIELKSNVTDSSLFLEVINNGPKIPPHIEEAMFRPYFTTKGEGRIGMGLTVARDLLSEIGGKITYTTSEEKTSFIIEFPL